MQRIGNNNFFSTERGAKSSATRQGYAVGAKIIATSAGYCPLALGEGADQASYRILHAGEPIAELTERGWRAVRQACRGCQSAAAEG